MLTSTEMSDFRHWLHVVSRRCVTLADVSLEDVADRLQTAGVLPVEGLTHDLANRWRHGHTANRAAATILDRMQRFAD